MKYTSFSATVLVFFGFSAGKSQNNSFKVLHNCNNQQEGNETASFMTNGFTITLEDLNYCDNSSSDYVSLDNLNIWRNLTSTGYIDVRKDIPSFSAISLSIYRIINNTTAKSFISLGKMDVCQIIETDTHFVPLLRQILNIPERCPIKKDHWVFKGVQIHKKSSRISVRGCFKCKIKNFSKNKLLSCTEMKVKVTSYMKENELSCFFKN